MNDYTLKLQPQGTIIPEALVAPYVWCIHILSGENFNSENLVKTFLKMWHLTNVKKQVQSSREYMDCLPLQSLIVCMFYKSLQN